MSEILHNTVFERVVPSQKQYDFNLVGPIEEPVHYLDLLQVMRSANEGDILNIYLNTPGGNASTMVQIINGIRNTKATVVAHLEGECHSAGTFIFLAADDWVVNPNCILLFHSYSGGLWGEGHKMIANAIANDKWLKQLCDDIYVPFLDRDEIDSINAGKDLWLNSCDVIERLEIVKEYRERLEKEEMQKVREAILEAMNSESSDE